MPKLWMVRQWTKGQNLSALNFSSTIQTYFTMLRELCSWTYYCMDGAKYWFPLKVPWPKFPCAVWAFGPKFTFMVISQ